MSNKFKHLIEKVCVRHSVSSRLALYIILAISGMFLALFLVFLTGAGRIVKQEAVRHANSELSAITSQIEGVLQQVQTVTRNMEWIVLENIDNPDSMYSITRRIILCNPQIIGSSIAFKPFYYQQKGKSFAPYSCMRSDGTIVNRQLGTDAYNYFAKEWYDAPMREDCDYWCEPYFDEGGADSIMTTFSHVLRDAQGNAIGVLTADVSLHQLTGLLNRTKPYPSSYTLMISRKGTYLAHPLEERILYANIDSTPIGTQDIARTLGESMMRGEQGLHELWDNGVLSYVFYKPVTATGWSAAIVCPHDEVFASLDETIRLVVIVFLVGLVLLLVFCVCIIRHTIRPLRQVTQAVMCVADGDLNAPLPQIRTNDEIGRLLSSFQHMQLSLVEYIRRLTESTAAKERIEHELQIARRIQMSMLPKIFPPFPERENLDLYAILKPAREVGGDLYDFFIRDEKLFFIIGDVSGKGVPASLLMAITRSLFRIVAGGKDSPAQIAVALNESIAESNEVNMFVTMYIGVLDLENCNLKFCNAGHNPPIIISPDGSCCFQEVRPNLPIGVMEGFRYEGQSAEFPNGTALLLYTDGVNEAENPTHEQFGEGRMMSQARLTSGSCSQSIVENLQQNVSAFAGSAEQSDDLTMLCIRLNCCGECPAVKADWSLSIRNRLDETASLPSFLHSIQENLSLADTLTDTLNLAIEEALVNVIQYAYPPGEEGEVRLIAHWDARSRTLTFTLEDNGRPFDPTAVADADTTLAVEDRPIGGLGIFLTRQLMDNVVYSRCNGRNRLTLSKHV